MIPLKDDNPASTTPFVTFGLIAVNLFVFSYMLMLGGAEADGYVMAYSVVPARFVDGLSKMDLTGVYTPVSSMFLHGGILHVGGNMLYLWIFGDNVEDRLGHFRFLAFYVACGVAAAAAQGLANAGSEVPMIGASGAVAGVLAAYMVMFPRARVWTFFFFVFFWQVIRVPALIIIGMWIVLQFVNGAASVGTDGGGVAWFAHIGGFFAGLGLLAVMGGRKSRRRV